MNERIRHHQEADADSNISGSGGNPQGKIHTVASEVEAAEARLREQMAEIEAMRRQMEVCG